MNGGTTIQVPATEDYSASNRIAMFSTNGTDSPTGSGTGSAGMTWWHFTWQWDTDTSTTDGFSGAGWTHNPGPFAGDSEADITTGVSNGTINVSNELNSWATNPNVDSDAVFNFISWAEGSGCATR